MLESEYHGLVAAWLRESFTDISHEVRLESGRRVDFIARTPFESYCIEVENSHSLADLYNGLGQCLIYARETGMTPILILPAPGYEGEPSYGPVQVETV